MKIPILVREVTSILFVSVAFLLLIPPVPSVEGPVTPSMFVNVAAVIVFMIGIAIGWKEGDFVFVGALKVVLFVGYVFLLLLRGSFG